METTLHYHQSKYCSKMKTWTTEHFPLQPINCVCFKVVDPLKLFHYHRHSGLWYRMVSPSSWPWKQVPCKVLKQHRIQTTPWTFWVWNASNDTSKIVVGIPQLATSEQCNVTYYLDAKTSFFAAPVAIQVQACGFAPRCRVATAFDHVA